MARSLVSLLFFGPLAAQAARKRSSCPYAKTVIITEYVTMTNGLSLTEFPKFPTTHSIDTVLTESNFPSVVVSSETSTAPTTLALSSDATSVSTISSLPETTSTKAPTKDSPSPTSSTAYADATEVDVGIDPTEQCGNDDRLIMPGMPWTVANSMYNSQDMVGTQCTDFKRVLQASNGTYLVEWTSTTDIERVEDTEGLCKGYSNIGIGKNLEQRLSDVTSIPAHYKWSRTINTEFKGAMIFDFITAAVQGDGESPDSHEFMLFLKIWGGQIPIGYADGPVETFDMYGTTWRLYEGLNETNGVTVRSMIPDTAFEGEFTGDLKIWLDAMAASGYISSSEFVNVGNCGVEVFYGDSQMEATVALDII